MKELFLKFRGLLKGIEGVRWTDKDKGQIDHYEEKPSVPFPCNLFKISIPLAETIAEGIQQCNGTLVVRTASDLAVSETSDKAQDSAVERSIAYYDIVDDVFNTLQGYTDFEIETIDRVSCIEEERKDGLTVVKSTFSVIFRQLTDQTN